MASMIFEEASGIAILTTRVRITANRFGERVWHSSSSNLGYLVERETRTREAERRAAVLSQILDPAAADRLGRIRLVKESRAADIENRLIMLAQTGQLRQKVTEEQLKELLGAVAESQRKEEEEHKIVITRRKGGWDDDDDDLLDL
ncbi:Double-stranded DNA-binding domain containing protein [Elaphomyces granulatus]